ncbi:dihydrodipicolinate synthase family protein [Kamptonema cortianum]|nr:dihydrodipicolinate synthase family protein [Geitlerinema splendidum]MDK3162209.1 dihydrodipicolinate synthase family protein [Kamptonema cortianum]
MPWDGVFPALTTQFHKDLTLDLDSTSGHIERMIQSGVSGLVMLGSLGENNALCREEKLEVIRAAVATSAGRVPVVSGVSELSTPAACEYVRQAEAIGCDGFMVLPCMAYHSDRTETLAHYRQVAAACSSPIIVYNNPIAYKVDITPDMLEEMADCEQFFAVKESSGDTRRITDIFNQVGNRYTIFSGVDDLALECTALGATGWIAGIGLAFPEENQHLWNLMLAGKWEEARELYRWYTPLLHLDVGNKFVQNIKLAIQEVGLGSEWVRMPRLPLSGEEREYVLTTVRKAVANRPSLPESVGSK